MARENSAMAREEGTIAGEGGVISSRRGSRQEEDEMSAWKRLEVVVKRMDSYYLTETRGGLKRAPGIN